MRRLTDFIDIHKGETVWLFGKGPSLDLFDMEEAGELRAAINDVAGFVPGCKYAFSNDRINPWIDVYKEGTILFTPARPFEEPILQAKICKTCEHIVYHDYHDDKRLATVTPRQLAEEGLSIRKGTIGSAIQILWIMGVTRIVLVGIDGGQAHAKRHTWRTRLRNLHFLDYNAIRNQLIQTAGLLGITLEFFGLKGNTNPNGTMKLRIIRNTFCKEVFCKAGQIIECEPFEAQELKNAGVAVELKEPVEPPTIERTVIAPENPERHLSQPETPEPVETPLPKRAYKRSKKAARRA